MLRFSMHSRRAYVVFFKYNLFSRPENTIYMYINGVDFAGRLNGTTV